MEDEVLEEEEGEEEDVFVPPDGGYGWFVTLGAFISLFWTSGLVSILQLCLAQTFISQQSTFVKFPEGWAPDQR